MTYLTVGLGEKERLVSVENPFQEKGTNCKEQILQRVAFSPFGVLSFIRAIHEKPSQHLPHEAVVSKEEEPDIHPSSHQVLQCSSEPRL